MARNIDPKCKRCRREGEKLFLKSERCFTAKCAVVKRKYPPGVHGVKKGTPRLSEYGQQLRAKQRAKLTYGILENQFIKYFKKARLIKGDTNEILLQLLELRLDNVVYRSGFTKSRSIARQLVTHRHFLVNDKIVNIPSLELKVGDRLKIKEKTLKSDLFKNLAKTLERYKFPEWLSFNKDNFEIKVINKPNVDDLKKALAVHLIIEFYSR